MTRFLIALAVLPLSALAAGLLFANLVLGCETFDRELWTPDSMCVLPQDIFH